ncbi:PTS sugar transporter subunit IIA [Ruoffia tabacinasalis]|uniref:PTS sugar transporter subunit IIA n=1 Tax=Ruoffia tabacinasalis TaxID=87458 RepID=A0A5R9DUF9_9LACT|nr:PTS sugar transporter subunit IIA [Ruoffia tabacinasalis]TLQ40802.1 PTS sugar transporter subunit IIA [Ruoffia tabacinasalis]
MIDSDVIHKEIIFLNKELDNKISIVDYILEEAKKNNLISVKDDLKKAVLEREEQISTSIGFDIAMPHGKSDTVLQPFVAFLRTKEGIYWDKDSDETVRMIFLIAVPSENKDNMHLKFISEISKKLLDDEFRQKLLTEENENEVYKLLQSIKQK